MPRIAGIDKSTLPVGTISPIGYDGVMPPGTILCDGSAIRRDTYAALFAKVGIAWGPGDGSTTFNLPDLRGTFVRGRTHGTANDPDAATRFAALAGGATGDAVGSYQFDAFARHSHSDSTGASGGGGADGGSGNGTLFGGDTTVTSGVAGSSNETRPKNAYANYVIAYA